MTNEFAQLAHWSFRQKLNRVSSDQLRRSVGALIRRTDVGRVSGDFGGEGAVFCDLFGESCGTEADPAGEEVSRTVLGVIHPSQCPGQTGVGLHQTGQSTLQSHPATDTHTYNSGLVV